MTVGSSSCSGISSAMDEDQSWYVKCFESDEASKGSSQKCSADGSTQQQLVTMVVEIEAAVTFLVDVIKASRFNEEATDNFKQALICLLKQHYEGHWYPNDPFKGSGYRCLRVNGVMNPLLTKAAQLSGLPIKKFRHAFPVELTVWVDPGDVSVRFGEEGSIGVYYAKSGLGLKHDHRQMEDLKKLVSATPKRSATPPGNCNAAAMSMDGAMSKSPMNMGSMSSRNSPAHNMLGSPPSTSFVFSPYDGKSMRVNPNVYSQQGSSSIRNLSPMRKYQQQVIANSNQMLHQQQQMFGRCTPPDAYLYQQPQQASFAAPHQCHFYGDLTKNDVSSSNALHQLEMVDFEASRRTPPSLDHHFPSLTAASSAHRRLYESPTCAESWSAQAACNGAGSNPSDYQFYNNTHFGSSWITAGASPPNHRGTSPPTISRFGRMREQVGVVN